MFCDSYAKLNVINKGIGMERLTGDDEQLICDFITILGRVATIEDMFPPDIGVIGRRSEPLPLLPPLACAVVLETQAVPA